MASPTANYNLPGATIDIADLGLRIAAPLPGPKLTLFGSTTSTLGGNLQINEPFEVSSFPAAIQAVKNADGTDSELSKALEAAVEAGAKRVEMIVVAQTSEYASANARWDALATAYRELKDYQMDHVHPCDAYADEEGLSGSDAYGESRTTFWNQLINFCHRATVVGNTVRGYIGLKPIMKLARDEAWSVAPTTDAEELFTYPTVAQLNEYADHIEGIAGTLDSHVADTALDGYLEGSVEQSPGVLSSAYTGWARDEDGSIAVDSKGQDVDGGRYVSMIGIIARQILSSTRTRAAINDFGGEFSENTNGATAYAAFCASLQPNQSPTNKPIQSLVAPRSIPSEVARRLMNARIVTMATRSNGFVVVKGVLGAHNAGPYTRSDFVLWSTFNIIITALDLARDKALHYIGQQSSAEILNALQNDVDTALNTLVQWGLARKVASSIIQTRDQEILGNLDIEINIVPTLEITNIQFRAMLHRD